jgi:hypothetical protein
MRLHPVAGIPKGTQINSTVLLSTKKEGTCQGILKHSHLVFPFRAWNEKNTPLKLGWKSWCTVILKQEDKQYTIHGNGRHAMPDEYSYMSNAFTFECHHLSTFTFTL